MEDEEFAQVSISGIRSIKRVRKLQVIKMLFFTNLNYVTQRMIVSRMVLQNL